MFLQNRKNVAGSNAGTKRPFDGPDPRPMKAYRPINPDRAQARKEARKEANAERLAQEDEEYYNISQEIGPMVASIIDSFGGVSTLSVISTDETLKSTLDRIPPGHSKKLKKILEMFPEHIVCLDDGFVVTAAGYENGIVSSDGVVDKEKKQEFAKLKKDSDKQALLEGATGEKTMLRVQRALARVAAVGGKEPEKPYQDAIMELNNARMEAFHYKGGARMNKPKVDLQKAERDCRQFANYLRRFMVERGYEAGTPMKMSEIASDNEAKRLHAQIVSTSGKKYKMGKIITDHPQFFMMERNELVGASEITLTEEGAALASQRPFSSKGKGKGNR